MSKSAWQERARGILGPAVSFLARIGATPTSVTLVGLLLNIVSAVAVGYGRARTAGLILIVAGICDALDGQLARRTGKTSRFGAFLDSSIDRIDESVVLAGIAAYFWRTQPEHAGLLIVATVMTLAGSLITSYTRARAEGLGLECKVGVFERPERVVVTVLGLLIGPRALAGAVVLILVLSWTTVVQRIAHVRRTVARLEAESSQVH